MYFSTIKKIAIVLFLVAFPLSALAAGLGSVNVLSALGEPLNASVELLSVTPAELASLQAKIDSEEAYSEQGLTRLAVHDEIKIRIAKDAGKDVLKLTSNTPVDDPFLDLLIVAEWSNGRIARQYTLLLDPPSYNRETSQIQAPAKNTFNNTSIKKQAIPDLVTSTETVAPSTSSQEHLTKRGDTLYKIARRMQPAGVSLDKVLVALFEENPDAFDGNNMNRLKVGKILQAPTEETLNAMDGKHVAKEIKLQTADWNKYRSQLAATVAQRAAEASGEDTQSSSGKIKSAAEDESSPSGAAPKDVVKLSATDTKDKEASTQAKLTALEEEISAREKGLKEAEDRTAALEKQIEDMQKLLALKNNTMSNAQEQAAQKDTASEALSKQEEVQSSSETPGATETVPEKPAPVARPKPVATPEEKQPSFLSSLLDDSIDKFNSLNKTILAVVVALLALLVAFWMYFRNKRSKKLEDFERGIMTSGSLKANTVFGDTATGMVATGDTSFLTDFSHSASNGLIDTNDVDPIAEAEVYMAYGRDAQAEEILKDAISKEPQRYELHHKLLEMYAANKNTGAFETVAGEMYTTLGGDNPTWVKVAEMGAKLEPNNPLYQLKDSVKSKLAEANPTEPELVQTPAVQAELAEVETIKETPSEDALDTSDFSDSPLAAEADLDFSISDNANVDDAVVAGVDNVFAETAVNQAENNTVETAFDTSESALQFDLDASDEVEKVAKATNDDSGLDFPILEAEETAEQEAKDNSVEIPSELTLDMPKLEEANTQTIDIESNEDSAIEDFDFGMGEESKDDFDTKQANILDVSGISLDIGDEISFSADSEIEQENDDTVIEEPLTPAYEEVETKLELVAAYIDMEDKDGAKELLEEVLKEGNASQRKRADQMLALLA